MTKYNLHKNFLEALCLKLSKNVRFSNSGNRKMSIDTKSAKNTQTNFAAYSRSNVFKACARLRVLLSEVPFII